MIGREDEKCLVKRAGRCCFIFYKRCCRRTIGRGSSIRIRKNRVREIYGRTEGKGERLFQGENLRVLPSHKFQKPREAAIVISNMLTSGSWLFSSLSQLQNASRIANNSITRTISDYRSSVHKVHTPTRHLSKHYIHPCKHWTQDKQATIDENTISALYWLQSLVIIMFQASSNS